MSLISKALCLLILALISANVSARAILITAPATNSPLINEFISALRTALPQDEVAVSSATAPDADTAEVIITLGSDMLNWRLQSPLQTPSIAIYVNSHALPPQPLPAYLHVVLANPKPLRQLRLAKHLLPRLQTAGLLYADNQLALKDEWAQALAASGLQQRSATVKRPDTPTRELLRVLEQSDALIGIDAPTIYNADNLKAILLTSYSRNKVLIGPSAPFIEAGSLSTTYSTAEDMARSVALLLQQGELKSGTSYPAFFSVLSNAQVARSLGLPIPDDVKLSRELTELEQAP